MFDNLRFKSKIIVFRKSFPDEQEFRRPGWSTFPDSRRIHGCLERSDYSRHQLGIDTEESETLRAAYTLTFRRNDFNRSSASDQGISFGICFRALLNP